MANPSRHSVYICCQISSSSQLRPFRQLHSAIWRHANVPKYRINWSNCLILQTSNLFRFYSHKLRVVKQSEKNAQDAVDKNYTQPKPTSETNHQPMFQEMMLRRQQQAQCSVLLELTSKEDANFAAKLCRDAGKIRKFIPYSGGYGNSFLLAEFVDEASPHNLLKDGNFKNGVTDTFPIYSRLLRYERRKNAKHSHSVEEIFETEKSTQNIVYPSCKASQLIQDLYEEGKLSDLSARLRFFFASTIQDALSGMFPYCLIAPFGSSVNSFGAEGCDLDLVAQFHLENRTSKSDLYFQTKSGCESRILQQRTLNLLYEILRNVLPGISYISRIKSARVPILKFNHSIFEMECDISAHNMSAVYMSEILYFLGSIDHRVRPLAFAVKKWAKEANVTYVTPGSWITNFSLSLLVMYFLQNRPSPILPPLLKAISINCSTETYSCSGIDYIENPLKWRELAKANNENLGTLLKEFLAFLSSFPFQKLKVLLLTGTATPRSDGYPLFIQYPLEEEFNVSKNVSESELTQLQNVAKISAMQLEESLRQGVESKDTLMNMLGIQRVKKDHSQRIDISKLYADSAVGSKKNARMS